ncbi:857_t:CDS:1, partial [Acaulospora morrowiae]
FDEFKKLGLTHYVGGYESTSTGRLHVQLYFQFKQRMTYKKVKEMFDDHPMTFPEKLYGNSDENRNYVMKKYNRCKVHSSCKCDYQDLDQICELCDETCKQSRTLSRWSEPWIENLNEDEKQKLVGVWEFGDYRFLTANGEGDKEISELKKDEFNALTEASKDLVDGMSPIEIFKKYHNRITTWTSNWFSLKQIAIELQPKIEYVSTFKPENFEISEIMQKWVNENLNQKQDRYRSLLVIGEARIGKTKWARCHGKHIFWRSEKNLEKWDVEAKYIVLDDITWNDGTLINLNQT